MPSYNATIKNNDGTLIYAKYYSPYEATSALIKDNGLVNSLAPTVTVYNGATYDETTKTLVLPITISGFSKTINATIPDSGYAVGDTIQQVESLGGGETLYAVETSTPSSGETWVLNESLGMDTLSKTNVTFTSNNENFVGIAYSTSSMGPQTLWYYKNDTEYVVACEYGTYSNQAYRTIIFNTAPTGNLLTWLQANGTKQGSTPTYKFKHWKKSNVVVNRTLVGEKYYYFKPYTILGLYRIDTTLTNCSGATANATKIQENGGLTLAFTANSGYELPTGVSVTNVTSYNWNKSTGVLAISKPTGDVTIEIVAVSALPQLSTPTNVSVTDTTLTFDEVENATSYEVFVDNVSIGTHTIASGETWLLNETLTLQAKTFTIGFTSNNQNFNSIVMSNTNLSYDDTSVYNKFAPDVSSHWASGEIYRTLVLDNAATGDLLTWLNANGTKQ